jgi:hypothetical protein
MTSGIKPTLFLGSGDDTVIGSASVDGRMIMVHATTSPGTLLHQGAASGATWDRVTIMACNNDTVSRDLTVVWGTDSPGAGDLIVRTLTSKQGLRLIVDRGVIRRTKPIYAYCAAAADVVNCMVEIQGVAP